MLSRVVQVRLFEHDQTTVEYDSEELQEFVKAGETHENG